MKKYLNKKRYEGFSLVEMLITIAIIGFVMTISSLVLTTLIRVSASSSNKIRARNESEFVLELLRRTVRNSNPKDIKIYLDDTFSTIQPRRTYDYTNNTINNNHPVSDIYENQLGEGEVGNEIHFRPYGYRDWICIALLRDSEDRDLGYILMASTSEADIISNPQDCFGSGPNTNPNLIVLNSPYINMKKFNIFYTSSGDRSYLISFDVLSEPLDWYMGGNPRFTRQVLRQGVVSTEGLIW